MKVLVYKRGCTFLFHLLFPFVCPSASVVMKVGLCFTAFAVLHEQILNQNFVISFQNKAYNIVSH